MDNIKTKEIIYKGKKKIIPEKNPDGKLCELFIIHKMRFCKFEKYKESEFCVYHIEAEETFVDCPVDPSHRVMTSRLQKHLKVCNKVEFQNKLKQNPWWSEKINLVKENIITIENQNINEQSFKELYDFKWEDLSDKNYGDMIDKIMKTYEILRNEYKQYCEENKLQDILNEKFKGNKNDEDFKILLSGISIDLEKDMLNTKGLQKSEKMGKQNEAISYILEKFNLINENIENKLENLSLSTDKSLKNDVFIEFGAGKGGLSHKINQTTENKSYHILLERDGVRYKKDKHSDKMIRFRTDILDFDVNYLDTYFQENFTENFPTLDYNLLGVAKHICGCALDLSLTCLFNYKKNDSVKGICMASCCHHISRVEYLNNLNFYLNHLNFSIKEIIYLFKATSWIFGPIDQNLNQASNNEGKPNEHNSEKENKKNKIFESRNIKKSFIGLISKYIVDFTRINFLISKDMKVFYIKYCDNEITTENNLILAIKNNLIN